MSENIGKPAQELLDAHKGIKDAIKRLEELSGGSILYIEVLDDGQLLVVADFEDEGAMDYFEIQAGVKKSN